MQGNEGNEGNEVGELVGHPGRSRRWALSRRHWRDVGLLGTAWRGSVLATVALGLVGLVGACGDDDGDGAASIEDFCTAVERINVRVDDRGWFEGGGLDEALFDAVRSVDPPGEIADAWGTVLEGTEEAANDEEFDGTDETGAAAEQVLRYVDVQCSVDLGSS